MLATSGDLPPEDGRWAYEVKWDGVRVLAAVEGGRTALRSRVGNDVTGAYPELQEDVPAGREVLLDGEVVALDEAGRPDFGRLQQRMHVRGPARSLVVRTPVVLVLFDVLHLEDRSLLDEPYDARRDVLSGLELAGGRWQVPASACADGAALLEQTRAQGLEGLVAKRRDSRYEPGRRSDCWVKVKNTWRQSAVVVGWQPGEGGRAGSIGSLLLAVQGDGGLEFAGHVGTGFSAGVLDLLGRELAPLATDGPACPVPREHARTARWVRPELVAEVEFRAWTRDGRLRHASFQGLRDDLDPADVVREQRGQR